MAKDEKRLTEDEAAELARKAAEQATEKARAEAAQQAQINECKLALEALASIQIRSPHYPGAGYDINRARQSVRITPEDIERARDVRANPKASLADCRKALAPLAGLPLDIRVEDPRRTLYSFPADPSGAVEITTETIERARALIS